YAAGVAEKLELAGAIITGTVALTDKFSHPQHRMNELLDVALNSVPESVDADALPSNSDGVETSAALLAAVLMADAPAAAGPPAAPPEEEAGDEAAGPQAEAPQDRPPSAAAVPDDERQAVLSAYTTLEYLERDGWETPAELVVVVTGLPDSESVAEVRGNPELAATVSTVDNAGGPQGQVATGLAVAERLAGTVGHYGIGDRAESMLPGDPEQ